MKPDRQPMAPELWVLVGSAFLIAIGFGIVAPVLPQFAKSFDVGIAAASAIVSVFALVRLVFAPAGGWLINRFGERRTYLVGLGVVIVSTALCGFASDYWSLLLFRGLGGIGSVMFTVSSMGLLVRLAPPEQRGRTSSLYGSSFLLGNIAGPIVGSALSGLGLRVPFFIYATLVALALVFVLVFMRRDPGAVGAADERRRMTFAEALASPGYRPLLLTGAANGWANFGVRVALLPLMAAAVPAIGVPGAGIALTLFAAGNAVAQQVTGRLADRVGRVPLLVVGLLFSSLVTVFFGWSATLWVFLALSAVAGVGAAFIVPSSQALLADIIGTQRSGGQALSTYSMAQDLGAITGTLLAGVVAQSFGFGWAFAITAGVLAGAAVPWLVGRRPSMAS
ncbi:MFS transporter [Aestuariimicrobium sp. T2.26MG-19.2B]|uniref:MFS transporter n=1 Tax=Aestuariimicrobium sp. T2.26MG-19.2B TaxID=3040679 RepID=UPI002541E127|nr:MFS transporter [Aestuariimicrobium sp. T2.26MG-19.2B]